MQDAVSESSTQQRLPAQGDPLAALELPALTLDNLSCECHHERQLTSWLENTQLHPYCPADQPRLVGMLQGMIEELAHWNAPASRRLPMLELLREYALACVDALALQRATLARAQTAELRKAVHLALQLLQQLAAAYAGVAAQSSREAGLGVLVRRRTALALQRGIDSLRRQVRITALFGLAPEAHCWRDMQLLLQFARLQRLDAKKVPDALHPQRRDSAAGAYLQAALFTSANPAQFDSGQQEQLWSHTGHWAKAATIADRYTEMADGLLASLALDQPPVPGNRLGSCKVDLRHFSAPRGWKVELGGVLAVLEKLRQRSDDVLLQAVQRVWGARGGRAVRRSPVEQQCDIAIGIGAISFHLGGARTQLPDGFISGSSMHGDHLCLDVDSVDFASGRTVNEYDVRLPDAPSLKRDKRDAPRPDRRYALERVNVLNSSAHGAGLSLPPAIGERLRVGELVAIRLREHWRVAVVRWEFALPDHCRAGVEVLAADALPVQVQRHTSAGQLSAPLAALWLQEEGADSNRSLILPVPLFKCYDTVELLSGSQTYPVTLQRQLLATGSFARFEFV
ncbi:hypothetical protein [Microbulbifer sp. SAOS-129_SWC]|uniref:hypothetical protein n=1 Tax=Microbulbifer sp. SAOS-129_SWC TaxID=3145235 RepID=UPI003217533C